MSNIIEKTSLFNGLNLNPIPLEMSQSMTTTKWLLGMDNKLSSIIDKINAWYNALITDIENNGILYQHIIDHLDGEFLSQLQDINAELSGFTTQIASIISEIDVINSKIDVVTNIKPLVQLSLNPSQELYNIGESINSVIINYNVTIGNEEIEKVEVYKNNILISTITTGIVNGNNSYIDANVINSDTEYKVIVYDKYNNITSNAKKYNFVNNIFFGVIGNVTVNEALIKSLTSSKTLKGSLIETFVTDNQKIVFAYPQTYGNLSSIIDSDNLDMVEGFTKSSIELTLNSTQVPYNVYVSNNFIYDSNVVLKFEF